MPGVGKTSIAELISKTLKIKHIDVDQIIEDKESETINDIISKRGEDVFRSIEKKELSFAINTKELSVISCGGGAVIDKENRHLIKNKTYGIHVKSSIEEICKRIEVSTRPLLYNTNKVLKLHSIWKQRKSLYNDASKITINIEGLSINEAFQKIYSRLPNAN